MRPDRLRRMCDREHLKPPVALTSLANGRRRVRVAHRGWPCDWSVVRAALRSSQRGARAPSASGAPGSLQVREPRARSRPTAERPDRRRRRPRARAHREHQRGGVVGARRDVHPRDRALLQRHRVFPGRVPVLARGPEFLLQGHGRVRGSRGDPAPAEGRRARVSDESPLQRGLRAGELRARGAGRALVRGRRVGAGVSPRAALQGIRRVLRPTQIPRAALPRGARAIRAAHHATGRDAGHLSGGWTHPRRKAAFSQDRAARLRARHCSRARVSRPDVRGSGGGQLRPGAGGSLAPPRAREDRGAAPAAAPQPARRRPPLPYMEREPAGDRTMEALRPRRRGRRQAHAARALVPPRVRTCSSCPVRSGSPGCRRCRTTSWASSVSWCR